MTGWACGIAGCGQGFESVTALIRHQAVDHPPRECAICDERLPAGFLAIRHAFEAHTRAEYVRAYDADSDDIRVRERLLEEIEENVDVPALVGRLEDDDPRVTVRG